MPSLIDIRRRVRSVKNTQQITKAMKMVSAAKLRRAQEQAEEARPYAERMESVLRALSASMRGRPGGPAMMAGTGKDDVHLVVVMTADRGLCGSFNFTGRFSRLALGSAGLAGGNNRLSGRLPSRRGRIVGVGPKLFQCRLPRVRGRALALEETRILESHLLRPLCCERCERCLARAGADSQRASRSRVHVRRNRLRRPYWLASRHHRPAAGSVKADSPSRRPS